MASPDTRRSDRLGGLIKFLMQGTAKPKGLVRWMAHALHLNLVRFVPLNQMEHLSALHDSRL
jgi:hypothetical protein